MHTVRYIVIVAAFAVSPASFLNLNKGDKCRWSLSSNFNHYVVIKICNFMLGTLWNILKKLGIEKEKPHHVLGDVKKLLMHEFPRQM